MAPRLSKSLPINTTPPISSELSSGPGAECEAANPSNHTLKLSEQAPGWKSLMSVLVFPLGDGGDPRLQARIV